MSTEHYVFPPELLQRSRTVAHFFIFFIFYLQNKNVAILNFARAPKFSTFFFLKKKKITKREIRNFKIYRVLRQKTHLQIIPHHFEKKKKKEKRYLNV